jgi:predicted RecB family nuclease
VVRLVHGTWLVSVNDAWDFLQCPQAFMNQVDAASGIAQRAPDIDEPLRRLMGQVLGEHRQRLVNDLSRRTTNIATIPPPAREGIGPEEILDSWEASAATTSDALGTADAVVGPVFAVRDNGVSGLPLVWTWSNDVIVHSPRFAPDIDQYDRGIEVWAAKLGSSHMGKTLFRLAATHEYAERHGIHTTNRVRIVFANGPDSQRGVHQSIDQWIEVRNTLPQAMSDHLASGAPISWMSERFAACGRKTCGWCVMALRHHDDFFLLPGISRDDRRHLLTAGFATVSGFAETSAREVHERVTDIDRGRLTRLHTQATLASLVRGREDGPPPFDVTNPGALKLLPPETPGDLFIDFEADPTFRSWSAADPYFPTPPKDHPQWWLGMDYLLGVLSHAPGESDTSFQGLWAESFDEEEANFHRLLDLVDEWREAHPDMHVYHYAPYEKVALHRMARRYRHGQDRIAQWEREGILVDLYRIFTKAVTAGIPNYSLKSVEKLFIPPGTRNSISGGAASVESIWEYWSDVAGGNRVRASDTRHRILEYNRQDTLSTQHLAQWLRKLSAT